MRYFQLGDDMDIAGRWQLGGVTRNGASLKVALDSHRPVEPGPVDIEIIQRGRPLQFTEAVYMVPVATNELALAMAIVSGDDIQRLPARVGGRHGYEVMHCTRLIDCVDETRSNFRKWTAHGIRPDKAGDYEWIQHLTVDPYRIPDDAHCFRIKRYGLAMIVSEEMRAAMEHVGCFGAEFRDVSADRPALA